MELIHMNYMKVKSRRSDGKDINVLVVTDHFTCCTQEFVTPSQTAEVVIQILWDKYFVYYGLPEKIISDQGKNFLSSFIEELCAPSQVTKLRTSFTIPKLMGSVNASMQH